MVSHDQLGNGTSSLNVMKFLSLNDDKCELTKKYPGAGKIIPCDNLIKFNKVPLVTPNGDILLECLDLEVPSGTNVLVCGPNGCGKSSLFRILGELWPLWGGELIKPDKGKLFYVPQVSLIKNFLFFK